MKAQNYIPPRTEIFRTQIESALLTASDGLEPEGFIIDDTTIDWIF